MDIWAASTIFSSWGRRVQVGGWLGGYFHKGTMKLSPSSSPAAPLFFTSPPFPNLEGANFWNGALEAYHFLCQGGKRMPEGLVLSAWNVFFAIFFSLFILLFQPQMSHQGRYGSRMQKKKKKIKSFCFPTLTLMHNKFLKLYLQDGFPLAIWVGR